MRLAAGEMFARPMTLGLFSRFMSGEVRKGERIPRRDPPEFEEANSFAEAIARDGILGTALDDKNQYGPVAMMVLLLIVAAITGTVIRLLG